MRKFVSKHKFALLVIIITIGILLIDDAVHKWRRESQPYFKDSLTPYEEIKVYDINDLTEEEFNKLFYGEEGENE